jgi:hypothetical protein
MLPTIQPISTANILVEAVNYKLDTIPAIIIKAVNEKLAELYCINPRVLNFTIDQLIRRAAEIMELNPAFAIEELNSADLTVDQLFVELKALALKNHWLDFELIYKQYGWGVTFDQDTKLYTFTCN